MRKQCKSTAISYPILVKSRKKGKNIGFIPLFVKGEQRDYLILISSTFLNYCFLCHVWHSLHGTCPTTTLLASISVITLSVSRDIAMITKHTVVPQYVRSPRLVRAHCVLNYNAIYLSGRSDQQPNTGRKCVASISMAGLATSARQYRDTDLLSLRQLNSGLIFVNTYTIINHVFFCETC